MLTDGRTDITNLIDAFRNFAKKPKNEKDTRLRAEYITRMGKYKKCPQM